MQLTSEQVKSQQLGHLGLIAATIQELGMIDRIELLGANIEAEPLNDDCLGRCLDKIAEYGVTKLYSEIAFEIAKEKGLLSQRLHLDSTSFVLYGRYEGQEDANPLPTYGYSKANRADLKQVMLSFLTLVNLPCAFMACRLITSRLLSTTLIIKICYIGAKCKIFNIYAILT